MALFNFDINQVEKRANIYELLPAGKYLAQITDSSVVPLKSGNGQALQLTFEILSDGYNGRKVFDRLNVQHTNPEAERIGLQNVRAICESIGVTSIKDTSNLHYKPLNITVKIRKDETGQYEDQNTVNGYSKASGSVSPIGFAKPAAPKEPSVKLVSSEEMTAAAPTSSNPPWAKK